MYRFDAYNEDNVLKIPLFLILINLYLLKQVLIFVFPLISSIPFLVSFAHEHFHILLLCSNLPAAFVLLSLLKRAPQTRSALIRWIWHKGRELLLSSLILECLILVLFVMLGLKHLNEVSLMFIYIDILLMIFMMKSQRIRDVFSEFPESHKKS